MGLIFIGVSVSRESLDTVECDDDSFSHMGRLLVVKLIYELDMILPLYRCTGS